MHITSPVTAEADSFRRWLAGVTAIRRKLDTFAEVAGPAPIIVAGDFDSTPDMRQFRDQLTSGYRGAAEQNGRISTWSMAINGGCHGLARGKLVTTPATRLHRQLGLLHPRVWS